MMKKKQIVIKLWGSKGLILTANAAPGSIPPPAAPLPLPPADPPDPPAPPPPVPPPPTVPPAVGGGVPWGTKVGNGGGAAATRARGAATATVSGLCRNSSTSSTEMQK